MNNHLTSITAVIPAYNAESTIRDALISVVSQSRPPDSIVVVDDASSDNTIAVADQYLRGCSVRYEIVRQPANSGPAAARNAGIHAANGEWIAFLDADDVWLPDKLKIQMELVQDISGGGVQAAGSPTEGGASDPRNISRLSLRDFCIRNPVVTSTVLVRKQIIEAAGGFDEQFRGPEDYDLWMRIAACAESSRRDGNRVVFVCGDAVVTTAGTDPSVDTPECGVRSFSLPNNDGYASLMLHLHVPLVWYRVQEGSLSMNEVTFLPQVLRVIKKAYGKGGALAGFKLRSGARSYQFAVAAWAAAENGRTASGFRLLIRSLMECPLSSHPDFGFWMWFKIFIFVLKRAIHR